MVNVSDIEILQIVDAVARDKGIAKEHLIAAMEQAVQVAGRRKYGYEHNIRAEISRKSGSIKLFRVLEVVETPDNYYTQIDLVHARQNDPTIQLGAEVLEELPPIDLGRVAAQAAKQVIVQRVSEVEREKQYQDFKDKKGEMLSGTVKRLEFGNIIVDLGGRAEAIIKKDQSIKSENLRINDRVKGYVQDVRLDVKGPLIFMSRTDEQMLVKLFELEVPEIYDGIIEIKEVARDPGSKAKIAVFAADSSVDPIGSCVGIRGNRVRAVTSELAGEKIDVVLWSPNVAQFVMNAMTPAVISKIVIDEDRRRVEVVVSQEQLSVAIGRRGQNVRLASKLTRWHIDVMTEDQESKRRNDEFNTTTELYMSALDVEEIIAQLLAVEGFSTIEQVASVDSNTLAAIEGFDSALATELQNRARAYVEKKNENILQQLEKLGIVQELIDILDLSPEHILTLAEYGVKTMEDLAEMTATEVIDLLPNANLTEKDVNELIAFARSQGK